MPSGAAPLIALFLPSLMSAAGPSSSPPPARLRLDVSAGNCISSGDLAARIAARSRRIQIAEDAATSAEVSVRASRPGRVTAELVLTTAGAEGTPRRVVARSCSEAADAIALIVAVTLDPTALRKTASVPAPGEIPVEGEGAGRSRPPGGTGDDASSAPPDAGLSATPSAPPEKPPPDISLPPEPPLSKAAIQPTSPLAAPESSPWHRHYAVALAGQTIFGPAPTVLPGPALYFTVGLERDGPWAPAFTIGATHVWRTGLVQPGGTASFTLDAASLDACPLQLRWWRFVARPCLAGLVGRLAARGSDTEGAASSARPFASAGGAVALTLGAPVELALRFGVGLTLIRDSYEFGDESFHHAARVTTSLGLGVGWRWP